MRNAAQTNAAWQLPPHFYLIVFYPMEWGVSRRKEPEKCFLYAYTMEKKKRGEELSQPPMAYAEISLHCRRHRLASQQTITLQDPLCLFGAIGPVCLHAVALAPGRRPTAVFQHCLLAGLHELLRRAAALDDVGIDRDKTEGIHHGDGLSHHQIFVDPAGHHILVGIVRVQ